jgi:hypothetical protein
MSCSCSFIGFFPGQQYLPRDGHIIERYHPVADGLGFFVSFAGQKYQVAGPCLGDGQFDGAMAIRLDDDVAGVPLSPGSTCSMMAKGSSPRGLSEVSTTTSLPAPAARPISGRLLRSRSPPQPNMVITRPPLWAHKLARYGDDIAQGVVGVGVVDHHGKILPAIDRLESTGHIVQRSCALRQPRPASGRGQRQRRPQPAGYKH